MDIESIRRDTREMIGDPADMDYDYLTPEFLAAFEGAPEIEPSSDPVVNGEDVIAAGPFYGNHPAYVADTSKPGFVGKLFIRNGSANRPNDPCGNMYHRVIWCRYSPRGTQYRNCGSFWGFEWLSV